jgi:hypothetical protein
VRYATSFKDSVHRLQLKVFTAVPIALSFQLAQMLRYILVILSHFPFMRIIWNADDFTG